MAKPIPVYAQEKDDGLDLKIASSASILYDTPIFPAHSNILKIATASGKKYERDQFDLYYFDSILVSTGWNTNDDVFTPEQVWAARHTPVDKMVNMGHNHADIIGHMVCCEAVDMDGKIIPDDTSSKDIPSNFELLVGAVIYKYINDENKSEMIDKLIEEMPNGEWCVSMECLFSDFDYAVINNDDTRGIIKRNEATAFLTKHLKRYGGSGSYEDYKIGRLLKGFAFSGKGMTKKPANKRSVVFADTLVFASNDEMTIKNHSEKIMSENNKEFAEQLERATKAEVKVATLEKELAAALAQAETLKAQVTKLDGEVKSKDSVIAERDAAIAKQTEAQASATEKLNVLKTELESAKAEKVTVERTSQLVSAGVSDSEAKKIVAKWSSVSNEQFADIVELHKVEASNDELEEEVDSAAASADDAEEVTDAKSNEVPANSESEKAGDVILAKASEWVRDAVLRTKVKGNK